MAGPHTRERFLRAFVAERLFELDALLGQHPELLHEDISEHGGRPDRGHNPLGLFSIYPLYALLDNSKPDITDEDDELLPRGPKEFSPAFSRGFVSLALKHGMDIDQPEKGNRGNSWLERGWTAMNPAAGAQLVLEKIYAEMRQRRVYVPNLDAVLCDEIDEGYANEPGSSRRADAMRAIGAVHDIVRRVLLKSSAPREAEAFSFLRKRRRMFFLKPFPYAPEDHDLFAKPPDVLKNLLRITRGNLDAYRSMSPEDLVDRLLDPNRLFDEHERQAGQAQASYHRAVEELVRRTRENPRPLPRPRRRRGITPES